VDAITVFPVALATSAFVTYVHGSFNTVVVDVPYHLN